MYPQIKLQKISHKPLVFENSNKTLKKGFSPDVSLSNSSSSQYLLCTACLVMFSVRRCLVLQCPSHRVPIPRIPHTVLAALSASQCSVGHCAVARVLCPTALLPPLPPTPRKAETLKADTAAVARRYYTRKEWVKDNQPNTRNARGTLVASRINDPSCIRRGHSG